MTGRKALAPQPLIGVDRTARLAAGLTQKQLALKMGTSQAAIARLETGDRLPTIDTLYRLAGILSLDFTITPEEPLSVRPHRAA